MAPLKNTGIINEAELCVSSREIQEQRLRHCLEQKIWDPHLDALIRASSRKAQMRHSTDGERTIMDLVQCRPEVCLRQVRHSWTLLPWLCHEGGSTFEALTELVASLHPTEVIYQDIYTGDTCLHIVAWNACRFSDTKLRRLLQLCPDPAAAMVMRNRRGGTALHAACSGAASLSTLQLIVTTNPEVLHIPSHEQVHAVAVLWQSYTDTIPGHMAVAAVLKDAPVSEPNAALLKQFWCKVEYLALQYFAQSNKLSETTVMEPISSSSQPNFVLHGLLLCHVPLPMVQFCCHYQPATALAADASGNLPLHVLMSTRPYPPGPKERAAVTATVFAATSAARISNRHGEIPLLLAIRNKVPMDIVEILLAAAPETIAYRDPEEGWYPFQLAAAVQGSNVAAVNTIYRLLRQQPDLLFAR